jgi:hypothetical protein
LSNLHVFNEMHEVDKEAEKVDASSLGSDGLRVIAHGIVGAESIIEYESRGGEAEGIGWRNPGHQHKKGESQIGTAGKEKQRVCIQVCSENYT